MTIHFHNKASKNLFFNIVDMSVVKHVISDTPCSVTLDKVFDTGSWCNDLQSLMFSVDFS